MWVIKNGEDYDTLAYLMNMVMNQTFSGDPYIQDEFGRSRREGVPKGRKSDISSSVSIEENGRVYHIKCVHANIYTTKNNCSKLFQVIGKMIDEKIINMTEYKNKLLDIRGLCNVYTMPTGKKAFMGSMNAHIPYSFRIRSGRDKNTKFVDNGFIWSIQAINKLFKTKTFSKDDMCSILIDDQNLIDCENMEYFTKFTECNFRNYKNTLNIKIRVSEYFHPADHLIRYLMNEDDQHINLYAIYGNFEYLPINCRVFEITFEQASKYLLTFPNRVTCRDCDIMIYGYFYIVTYLYPTFKKKLPFNEVYCVCSICAHFKYHKSRTFDTKGNIYIFKVKHPYTIIDVYNNMLTRYAIDDLTLSVLTELVYSETKISRFDIGSKCIKISDKLTLFKNIKDFMFSNCEGFCAPYEYA